MLFGPCPPSCCTWPCSRECSAPLLVTHWVSRLLPTQPSSQFLLFAPLPAFLSYAGAQLWFNLGESASLGYLNFPPLVPLIKLPKLPAFIELHYLYFPPSLSATSCAHVGSRSKLPSRCPSTASCIHRASISKLPPRCPAATSCIHMVSYLLSSCWGFSS
jgi:hypothetical protein